MKRFVGWLSLVAVVAVSAVMMAHEDGEDGDGASARPFAEKAPSAGCGAPSASAAADEAPEEAEAMPVVSEAQSDEEKAEAAAEARVEEFDGLTDRWTESAKTEIALKDVEAFSKAFDNVPKARRDECIHRALNLIPDENVMLLVGILMDRTMDSEIVETVFADLLNRDEDVKMPIMRQIYRDKTHPCWADVAWILDATGETKE